jgi:hypothetical protein
MKQILAFFLGAIVAVGFAASVSGCIPDAAIVPQTPQNAQQIADCQTDARTHNGLVVGDFVLSGGATGVGAVAAFETNTGVRTGLAISSAILGAGTAIATGLTAYSASQFTNSNCTAYVGPLAAGQVAK